MPYSFQVAPSFFPNPASQSLFIEWKGLATKEYSAELINVVGQVVRSIPVRQSDLQEVPVHGLPRGLYFVRFHSAASSWEERIILH